MKTVLPSQEVRREARSRNARFKEINQMLRELTTRQDSHLMAAANLRCPCCSEVHKQHAETYQPEIDRLRAEKLGHESWFREYVPGILERVARLKEWMITSDGYFTRSIGRHVKNPLMHLFSTA